MRRASFIASRALLVFAALALLSASVHADALQDARECERTGDRAAAVIKAREAIMEDPSDVRALRYLQDLLLQQGQDADADKLAAETTAGETAAVYLRARRMEPEAALKALRKIKSASDAPETVRLDLGATYLALGNGGSAESEMKSYVKAFPTDPVGHTELGRVYVARGKLRDARKALDQAVLLEPGGASQTLLLAEVMHAQKQGAAARGLLRDALQKYPANKELKLGLGQDLVRAGEYEAALKSLQELATERGASADAHAWFALVQRKLDLLQEAQASAKQALDMDPANVIALETMGFCQIKSDEFEAGEASYKKAKELAPRRVEPLVGIAFAQIMLGAHEAAKDELEAALKLDKDDLDANLKMGVVLFVLGKNRTARKHLEKVLKEDENNITALRHMGYVYVSEGKPKDALKVLNRAFDLDMDDAKTARMIGRAYFEMGKKDEALGMFERAVDLDGSDPWAHFDRGKCLDDREEYQEAKQAYEKAIGLDAKFCFPHLYLAEIYDQIDDDPEMALDHYKRFLELGGPDPDDAIADRVDQLTED